MTTQRSIRGRGGPWALTIAIALFFGILGVTVALSLRLCQGHFGYPLDDAYIHMAMAKNVLLHGVWGVTRYGFSSSTSSPFYTLLLAVTYRVTGIRELTPFLLNILFGVALLRLCDWMLRDRGVRFGPRLLLLCLIVLMVPLYTLALIGMEHVLHVFLTLLFVHFASAGISDRRAFTRIEWIVLMSLASVLVVVRYEAVFVIAMAGLLFLITGRWMVTAGLALASILPLATYGWFSWRHGWYAIPNSLVLKANLPGTRSTQILGGFAWTLRTNAVMGFPVILLIVLAGVLFWYSYRHERSFSSYSQSGLIIFAGGAVLHLGLARVGWFYRYESYLIAAGMITTAAAWNQLRAQNAAYSPALVYGLGILFLLIAGYRSEHATLRAPQAVSDIYGQQYQMGLFARDHLAGKTVVLNDIGAVSFLSEARVLDLIGLGSIEPVTARLEERYSPEWLAEWSARNHADLALIYPSFAVPRWTPVATWTIPGNYMSASDTVGFYALDPAHAPAIRQQVEAFRERLPRRVVVREF